MTQSIKRLLHLKASPTTRDKGEHLIQGVSNTAVDTVLDLVRDAEHGEQCNFMAHIVSAAGTTPASVDIELFDTDAASLVTDSINTIHLIENEAVTGASNQRIFNGELQRPFATKGTGGKVTVRITFTGADGTTDYDFVVQLWGEEYR